MIIDVFCHISPDKYLSALGKKISPEVSKDLPSEWLPALKDLDVRFKVMDNYPDLRQILTLANPPVEVILDVDDAIELSRVGNDELAELVQKYPDRFVGGVACLPMNDVDAALLEAERAVKELGLNGVQIFTNVMGKPLDSPEFFPLYELMEKLDRPIWIHPFFDNVGNVARSGKDYDDFKVFTGKKDHAWAMARAAFDLPAASALAMTRLVYGKVFDLYPNIKFITHHCGADVPYYFYRIQMHHLMFGEKEQGELGLNKPLPDYFKMFYVDTALHGNVPGLMTGYHIFGADHMLFGTDAPFGSENGLWPLRMTVDSVEKMAISAEERQAIHEGNIKRLLHL